MSARQDLQRREDEPRRSRRVRAYRPSVEVESLCCGDKLCERRTTPATIQHAWQRQRGKVSAEHLKTKPGGGYQWRGGRSLRRRVQQAPSANPRAGVW
eukprot:400080-Rhodomonas_salina.3